MRTYPNNSPQAAARIVALAMLADAQLCKAEIDVLERLRAHEEQLGLCVAVIEADGQVVEGEAIVLRAVLEQWGLQRRMLPPARSKWSVEHV